MEINSKNIGRSTRVTNSNFKNPALKASTHFLVILSFESYDESKKEWMMDVAFREEPACSVNI